MVKVHVEAPKLTFQAEYDVPDGLLDKLPLGEYYDVLRAVSPTKYKILRQLYLMGGRGRFTQILQGAGLKGGSLSMHFRNLVYLGLISKDGGEYVLTLKGTYVFALVTALIAYLAGEKGES